MATIHEEIVVEASPEVVWDAVRDVGALHTRLVPGFVIDVKLERGTRVVTFGNGTVAREAIVSCDDVTRRLVWTIIGGRMTHHNGAVQVTALGPRRSRFVWLADLLPHDLAPAIAGMMSQAMPIVKRTLEHAQTERDQESSRGEIGLADAPLDSPR